DYMNFAKGKDAKDPEESSGDSTIAIHKGIRMDVASVATFDVFDLTGKQVASFTARSMLEAKKLWRENAQAKSVQGFSLIRNRSNGAVARVRSVR
ncbi:glycoside hydrolase, partial [Candidatus Saccharibacteria bacterium]|nr:glycoside hydrolase [Candidatus Saccharibacteria bacterium]